jgi:hypothetical protein
MVEENIGRSGITLNYFCEFLWLICVITEALSIFVHIQVFQVLRF